MNDCVLASETYQLVSSHTRGPIGLNPALS